MTGPGSRPATRGGPGAAVAFVVVLMVAGVAAGALLAFLQPHTPTATPTPLATGASGSLPPPVTGAPETAAPTGVVSGSHGTVAIDPSLLNVLPSQVMGLPLTENADGETQALSDPTLGDQASALAAALVIDSQSGDFAYASVVHLRPGVFSAAYYRSWRQTFDDGACSQAGGAGGSAEATIGGYDTFIGHCAGGILTYHVYLADRDLIVSISAVGDRRLGEAVVAGIRD